MQITSLFLWLLVEDVTPISRLPGEMERQYQGQSSFGINAQRQTSFISRGSFLRESSSFA